MKKFKELLFEAPQLVDPTTFGLEDRAKNRALAAKLISKKQETIEHADEYEIIRTGDARAGYFALITSTEQPEIHYLVRYASKRFGFIDDAVSQIALWRRLGSPYVQGLTRIVFYDVLLKRWRTVLSDGG